ncbi:MAG: protoheme IX farnesyltransferase [bacterium TMED198]|nr:MAG: protoheme IX farnesyltransferase [bacterium TMED198]
MIKNNPYYILIKPGITMMVMVTSYLGYYLGLRDQGILMVSFDTWLVLFFLLLGTFFSSSGACALNQAIEREEDSQMERTKNRPIPAGKISSERAFLLGVTFSILGVLILFFLINAITAIVSLSTIFLYIFVYTPLKKYTTWNTLLGSIPGALPPIGGWTAATGRIDAPAWILFGILFCWQMPHFLSIAVIYASDYKKGDFKMLPSVYPESRRLKYIIMFFSLAMVITTIGLYIIKMAGVYFAVASAVLGMMFILVSIKMITDGTVRSAKQLMFASILYLPSILIILILEKIFIP